MKTLRLQLKSAFALVLVSSTVAYAQTPQSSGDCPDDAIPADCPNAPQQQQPVSQAPPEPQPQQPQQPPPQPEPYTQQPTYQQPTYQQPQTPVVVVDQEEPRPLGFSLSLGGGVDDFVEDDFRDLTSTGGSWNVRGMFGWNQYLALEGSYIGSAQSIDAFGLDTDAILVGNGAQGALRVNATRNMMAQPFVYGGVAWRHYSLSNTDINTSDVADSDDVLEIPVGIGVAGHFYGFSADLRGEYRFATDEDLIIGDPDDFDGMDRWGVMANIGYSL